jgi:hypothetical protein
LEFQDLVFTVYVHQKSELSGFHGAPIAMLLLETSFKNTTLKLKNLDFVGCIHQKTEFSGFH